MQALLPSLRVVNEDFEHRPTAKGGGAVDLELSPNNADKYRIEYLPGGKPEGQNAARAYLKNLVEKAGIDKKVTPRRSIRIRGKSS